MDPRELWNRHTVLAEAFCLSDEHVRSAQSALDERQAHRARLLAAFAVTVGNDRSVADLLGLSERAVRVARRTVGKDTARRTAEDVLTSPEAAEGGPEPATTEPAAGAARPPSPAPHPQGQHQETAHGPGHPTPQGTAHHAPQGAHHAPQGTTHHAPHQPGHPAQPGYTPHSTPEPAASHPVPESCTPPPEAYVPQGPETYPPAPEAPGQQDTAWTTGMDVVLIDSWRSGVDLRVLADEFGIDLARLVFRVQQLAAEGRLPSPHHGSYGDDRAGRHRRDTAGAPSGWEAPATIPDEMVASYLPRQQAQYGWPQYHTAGSPGV